MVKCEKSQCSFIQCSADDPCGTTFVVSSDKWEIGRAVAIADDAFLKNVDEKTIKVSVSSYFSVSLICKLIHRAAEHKCLGIS